MRSLTAALAFLAREVSRLPDNPSNLQSMSPADYRRGVRDSFCRPSYSGRLLISVVAITLFAQASQAQSGLTSLQSVLHKNAVFDQADLAQLQQGEATVKVLPARHKHEIAVFGLVRVQAPPEVFLQSFRDTMATRSTAAILEIGRFGPVPSIDDLSTLTMESEDIQDLKKCVVGDCELKLSAKMIDQFQKTVDWQSSDYASQATGLYKTMLLDYVRDYLTRGDKALIEYTDKSRTMSVLDGQRALLASLPALFHQSRSDSKSFRFVEDAIVWSKIKFGLKPVLAINHITIFKSELEDGPQILILSKQIYANHYFNGSVGVTGLLRNPGNDGNYLFYENHSLADGLQGLFSGIKRRVIEREAADGLKGILKGTQLRLDSRAGNEPENAGPPQTASIWKHLRVSSKQRILLLLCLTGLAMLVLASYYRKANIPRRKHAS